ncbi:shikimate dehydrogenase [Candidatus Gottesmanbacteria bacterium RIFCSPHIGHO2_01_FULL_39_10]|uniref:Shikimate dehydrogenase (NADP(+)) n=1 Tax=Candidatus Gottesmanbacteria bacterium RIFCSPHIGHO2_01_FULL_39_10 TaxID=1798375 RepID=A0A1F5ZMM1_9BACT|nr:MAG: shikimate dehydrogenase [Candidatus Gottesmanbacteria bacterium RIFCSPHIGHO2_01_FULL_39_10]
MIIDTQSIDLKRFTSDTQLFGVIGNPVSQSLSPLMHNAAFKKLDLNCIFFAIQILNLKKSLQGLKMLGFSGLSVTIPFKIEVMKYLDRLEETAKNIGAVNTILLRNNKLFGTNTDWIGAIKALEEKINLSDKTVTLLGDGGASRAIAYGLKGKNAKVTVLNRKKLQQQDQLAKIKKANIIINATPVGMAPHENQLPIPRDLVTKQHLIFDIVFKPRETKLLKAAKRKGATIVYGDRMLLYQAVEQFKLFTGLDAPIEIMEKALSDNLSNF